MHPDLLVFIDDIQDVTHRLGKKELYKLYFDVLPKQSFFSKYIKSSKLTKYTPELTNIVCTYFEISKKEANEYIDLLGRDSLSILVAGYGNDNKEVKKILKGV